MAESRRTVTVEVFEPEAASEFGGRSGRRSRFQLAALFLAILGGALTLHAFDPAVSRFYPPCPFKALTGLDCPGCGTLRGLHGLSRGDLLAALDHNALMVLTLPFILYALVSFARETLTGRRLPTVFIPGVWIRRILYLILAFWILRNLPFPPFSYLGSG